jgi:hypothetical protein
MRVMKRSHGCLVMLRVVYLDDKHELWPKTCYMLVQFEYDIRIWLELIKKNIAITVGHRWLMRSNLQQSNGLDALFKSTRHQIFWKCDLYLPNMWFRLSIWPNGHRESQKYVFVKWIPRTNEATGLFVCPLIQLKRKLGFASRCLFGPGITWTSAFRVFVGSTTDFR